MVAYAWRHGEQDLPHGFVRRRMALHQRTSSRAQRTGTPQTAWLESNPRRRLLRPEERLPLAVAAEGFPALAERLRLVQEMAHRRHLGTLERRAAPAAAVSPWQEPEPQCGHRGFPVSQDHGGGRPRARLRPGKDPAKRVVGRKRHLLVDTEGLLLQARVHSARVPDEDGIRLLLESARDHLTRLSHLWVDAGY
jgi:hypothetical protein